MNSNSIIGKRIIVLGCPGSGKSTFASRLNERTGLPLYHLDNIWWLKNGTHITREEFDVKLEEILKTEKWIIDGDYSRTYEARIRSCDTIIFLDYSEDECMKGITERVGKRRPDIPWVEDSLDPELVETVRNYRKDNRPVLYSLFRKYPDKKTVIFRTRAQADSWLSGLPRKKNLLLKVNYF